MLTDLSTTVIPMPPAWTQKEASHVHVKTAMQGMVSTVKVSEGACSCVCVC